MKTYTAFLDMLIMSFLVLAIYFNLTDNYITDNYITDSVTGRRGGIRIMVISWQTFFVVASFCVFLRYIARNVR